MDRIEKILKRYDEDLERAKAGTCTKVTQRNEFRIDFNSKYNELYKSKLEEVKNKLLQKNHMALVEEQSSDELHYGFTLTLVPRHLCSLYPADKYYPHSLKSSISFTANEHTLSVDIETFIRPAIEHQESNFIEKIPRDEFNEDLLIEKVGIFLEKAFNETIALDFGDWY
jgi:hypothetical protein